MSQHRDLIQTLDEPTLRKPSEQGGWDYAGIVRGPGQAWWRMPVSLVLWLLLSFAGVVVLVTAFSVAGALLGQSWDWWLDDIARESLGPTSFLLNNLFLAALVPAVVLANRIGQGIGIGFTHSVAGRWRWGWFGQTILLLLPLVVAYVIFGMLFLQDVEVTAHPELLAMLLVVWFTTPLQCAGEEYAFRGWFLQNIGGLFANRKLAWVVPTALSAGTFALLHGSLDPWVLGDLALFAIAVSVMTWRTGGLEAAVALHTCNNMVILHFGLIIGGFEDSIVGPDTTGSAVAVVLTLASQTAAVALVWWWAKRRRVQQYTGGPTRPRYQLPARGIGPEPETQRASLTVDTITSSR